MLQLRDLAYIRNASSKVPFPATESKEYMFGACALQVMAGLFN